MSDLVTTAYTIGARPTYDSNLATWSRVRKTGRRLYEEPPYEGGWDLEMACPDAR